MAEAETRDLVQRAQRGDAVAFEALTILVVQRLYGVAHRALRDEFAAQDAVQDALIRAWRDIRALRDPDRFEAWAFRLLVNACRDRRRREARRPHPVAESIDIASIQDVAGDVARRDQLERGFRRLTTDHRIVLVLHHYLGMRPGEIADLLGIPEGTVASRLHYGARALRSAIEADLVTVDGRAGVR